MLQPVVHGGGRLLNQTEKNTCSGGQAFLGDEGEGQGKSLRSRQDENGIWRVLRAFPVGRSLGKRQLNKQSLSQNVVPDSYAPTAREVMKMSKGGTRGKSGEGC